MSEAQASIAPQEMWDPYDEAGPVVMPEHAVALVGHPGARVPLTGAMLSSLSGLPLADLDRLLEHASGRSLAHLWSEWGRPEVARLEAQILGRVLRERPPPVVVLGHDTLEDAACRSLVAAHARLFVIERAPAEVAGARVDRSRRPAATGGGGWGALLEAETIAATGLHPHRVAAAVLSRLQQAQGR